MERFQDLATNKKFNVQCSAGWIALSSCTDSLKQYAMWSCALYFHWSVVTDGTSFVFLAASIEADGILIIFLEGSQ